MLPRQFKILLIAAIMFAISPTDGWSGDLVYRPVNPSFGGDPFNSGHLLSLAQIQNQFLDDGSAFDFLDEEPSTADDFIQAIQGALVAATAGEVIDAVFEQDGPASGQFTLDGALVTYETVGDRVIVRVNDGIDVNTLDIPIPTSPTAP